MKRLDGRVDEVVVGLPPNNPAFAPRKAHPGGKIVTNDKLEVKLKFYERKGMALTPELLAKVRRAFAACGVVGFATNVGRPHTRGVSPPDACRKPSSRPPVRPTLHA